MARLAQARGGRPWLTATSAEAGREQGRRWTGADAVSADGPATDALTKAQQRSRSAAAGFSPPFAPSPAVSASIDDPAAAVAARRYLAGRVGVYAFLTLFAFIYVLPLFVVIANSFRPLPEIIQNGLIGFPHGISPSTPGA